jgi:mannose-1-phosphate guanylyltransferase/phosphomannomutase
MKAFVLCGGEGTRLRPYTYDTPKPLLKVGGKAILQYVIENLRKGGVDDICLTVGYLHEQIMDFFGDGSKLGTKISYSVEEEKLNTAGSIVPLKDRVDGTFVVAMGDHITNIDMKDMIEQHRKSGAKATIALLKHEIPLQFGVADVKDGSVSGFREKPVLKQLFNIGIYVFEPEIFSYIKKKDDFAKNVFPRMLEKGERINAYVFDDIWYDLGHTSEYERLNSEEELSRLRKKLGQK